MLYEGHVLACIEIVDEISIATSVNFTINILIDPNNGKTFVESDDYTDFQNFIINLNTLSDQMQEQMINYENEFEQMQLDFTNFSDLADTVAEIQNQNEEIQNSLDGINLSEIQEFVENYEEPTLSLGDNDVTTNIIADKAVTLNKLSDEVTQKINTKNNINLIKMSNGTTVTVNDAYAAPPLGLTVDGKSVQDGTPTPSSPVAIESVGSVTVNTGSKNLLTLSGGSNLGITVTKLTDGGLHVEGTRTGNATIIKVYDDKPADVLKAGHTYTISTDNPLANVRYALYGKNGSSFTELALLAFSTASNTFTLASEYPQYRLNLLSDEGTATTVNANVHIQIEEGSTATPYAKEQNVATIIPLDGHVLRSLPDGTHDELQVDADGNVTLVQRVGMVTFDGSNDEGWFIHNTNSKIMQLPMSAFSGGVPQDDYYGLICSHFQTRSKADVWTGLQGICFEATSTSTMTMRVADGSNNMSLSAWKEWLASNPITVVYARRTSVTYDLGTINLPDTPAPDLTVWAATDPITNISLTYNRDIGIVINNIEEALNNLLNS